MNRTIIRDLSRNADDRLELWAKDTSMRFEAINAPEAEAISVIISTLLGRAIHLLKFLGMSRNDFLILAQQAYDQLPSETRKDQR